MYRKSIIGVTILFIATFFLSIAIFAQVANQLTVLNNDVLVNDANGDGLADPDDVIRYEVIVANCGDETVLDARYDSTMDSNTQLRSGSVTQSGLQNVDPTICAERLDPIVPSDVPVDDNDDDDDDTRPVSVNAIARDDDFGVTIGATTNDNVLTNDSGGAPLTVVSFGDSLANVGTTPADGATILSIVAGGGTIDVTIDASGVISIDATTATGSGTITIFYEIQAGNGTTDIGQIDIAYGDFPTADDDTDANGVTYTTAINTPLNVAAGTGLLNNDTLGTPAATLVSFGGGDLPGDATRFNAGVTRNVGGVGTITVNADGSFDFVPTATFTGGFTFTYRLENAVGFDDATVEIFVEEVPVAVDDSYQISLGATDNTNNVTDNDTLGAPPAVVDAYADTGDIGGGSEVTPSAVYTHPTSPLRVTIAADGSLSIDATDGTLVAGTYTLDYQITNLAGSSVATITIEVVVGPVAEDDAFGIALGDDLINGDLTAPNPNPGGVADTVGVPPFDVATFGGGSLGGNVNSNTATPGGTSVALAGGTLTISIPAAGSLNIDLVGATIEGTYTFDYQITSTTLGISDTATVTIVIDAPPRVDTTTPADADTNIASNATVDITFTEDVNIAGDWITIVCNLSGTFSPSNGNISVAPAAGSATSFVVTPTGGFDPAGETCDVTLVAAQITDNDGDPDNGGGEPATSDQLDGNDDFTGGDNYTFTFSTADQPPSVTTILPADGATIVASDTTVDITFSENVDLNGAWIELDCELSGIFGIGTGLTSAPVAGPTTNPVITIAGGLQAGEDCDVTIFSNATNGVTDSDIIDPPNLLDGDANGTEGPDFTSNFVVDDVITVTLVNPANAAANVVGNSNIVITFSEAPSLNGSWFQIACTVSNVTTANSTVTPSGNMVTIDPDTDFGAGESCTLTVFSNATNGVTDADAGDPPDLLDGDGDNVPGVDFTSTFATADTPPQVTSSEVEQGNTFGAATTIIDSDTNIEIVFSEAVDVSGNWATLSCAPSSTTYTIGAATLASAPAAGPATNFTLNPSTDIPFGDTCTLTLESTLITDNDAIDPPDELDGNSSGDVTDGDADDYTFVFTIDEAITVTSTTPTNGAAGVGIADDIVIEFSEVPTLTGGWFTIVCDMGTSINTGNSTSNLVGSTVTINPTPDFAVGETCTATIISNAANGVTDADAGDPPNLLDGNGDGVTGDNYVFTFSTADTAPTVTTAQVELGGAFSALITGIDANTDIQIVFSEDVNVTGNWARLICTSGAIFTVGGGDLVPSGAIPGTTFTLNPSVNLPFGDDCTLTLESTLITDNDGIDPPDELDGNASGDITDGDADDFSLAFTIDDIITVTGNTPATSATNIAVDADVVIDFSEIPTLNGGWFDITCSGGSNVTTGTSTIGGGGTTTITIDPTTDFNVGELCTVQVFSSATNGVTDADAGDPPDLLDGNGNGFEGGTYTFTFTTVDTPPQVTRTQVEVAGMGTDTATTDVDGDTTIVIAFTEAVDVTGAWFTVNCGTSGNVTAQFSASATPATVVTLTNGGASLLSGETCTVTLNSALVTDNDAVDPPDTLDGNGDNDVSDADAASDTYSTTFTIDVEPSVTSVTVEKSGVPGDITVGTNDTDVDLDTDVVINFSEAVFVTAGDWLTITCTSSGIYNVTGAGGATLFGSVSGAGTNQITITFTAALTIAETCTIAIDEAQVTDADASDPPNVLANYPDDDFTLLAATPPMCAADAYSATGHISIDTTVAAGNSVLSNDTGTAPLTVTTIVGSGDVTAPFVGTTTQGGTVTMGADGEFVYNPPAGFNGNDTFSYELTNVAGSTTTNCDVTIAVNDLIYFMDSAAGAGGDGTLAAPFQTPAEHNGGSVVANSFLFINDNGADVYSGNLQLVSGETVIGEGATGTLFGGGSRTGITLAPLSVTVPYNLTGAQADWPQFTHSDDIITLNADNELVGLNIGNSGVGAGIADGVAIGDLTISESQVIGTGNIIEITNGGTSINANFLALTTTSAPQDGILIDGVGSGTFQSTTTTISGASNNGVEFLNNGFTTTLGNAQIQSNNDGLFIDSVTGNVTVNAVGDIGGSENAILVSDMNATLTINDGGTVDLLAGTGSCADIFGNSVTTTINITVDSCGTVLSNKWGIRLEDVDGAGFTVNNITGIVQGGGGNSGIRLADSTATLIDISDGNTLTLLNRREHGIDIDSVTSTVNFGTSTINNGASQTEAAVFLNNVTGAVDFDSLNANQGNQGAGEGFSGSFPNDNEGLGDAVYGDGATGGLTIGGGTIRNIGDDGIEWRNSGTLTLNNVTIDHGNGNPGRSGIQSFNSQSIIMTGGAIDDFGGASAATQRPLGVNILHSSTNTFATGTFTFDSVDFDGGAANARGGGIAQFLEDDADIAINVINGSTFANVFGKAIITQNASGASGSTSGGSTTTTITGNTFSSPLANGESSIEVQSGGVGMSGDVAFNINNNTFTEFGDGTGSAIRINLNQDGNARTQTNTINGNTVTEADAANGIVVQIDETSGLRLQANNNTVNQTSNVALLISGLEDWSNGEVDISLTNNDFFSSNSFSGTTILQDGQGGTNMRVFFDDVDVTIAGAGFLLNAIDFYSRNAGRLDFVAINSDFVVTASGAEGLYAEANSSIGTGGILCVDLNDDGGGANTSDLGFFIRELGSGNLFVENGTTGAAVIGDNPGMNTGFTQTVTGATQADCNDAAP